MNDRIDLWRAVHEDLVDKCAATAPQSSRDNLIYWDLTRTSSHDLETVERRVKTEGESFFTLTLPAFGKEFLGALDRGCLLASDFEGWRRGSYRGSAHKDYRDGPKFLFWAMQIVFSARHVCPAEPNVVHPCVVEGSGKSSASPTGEHIYDPESETVIFYPELGKKNYSEVNFRTYDEDWAAECVHAILQLSGLYSKEKRLASDAKNRAALDAYVATDLELVEHLQGENFPSLRDVSDVKKVMTLAFAATLTNVDREVYDGTLLPKHGPGATADKLVGNEKWLLTEWTERLQRVFPVGEYLYANDLIYRDSEESIVFQPPESERPVKVVLVPKTQATPRVIAIEPTCMQFVQQAFMRSLVLGLEKHAGSKDFVGFTDQEPNQRLAALGSCGSGLATLDLSEASDRVANWLVEELFADFPHFLEGIQACRSTRAGLPDGRIITLAKFASMGSALTFPIEAMVFSSITLVAVCRARSLPLTAKSLRSLRGLVRVYGDDIIAPDDCAVQVADLLETFGFKVNRRKSFWTGEFRESCGKEYWRGRDVTHVKVRTSLPADLRSATEVISTSSTRNQLFEAGFVSAVEFLDRVLLSVTHGRYPFVEATSPLVGRLTLDPPSGESWDENLHVPVAVGYVSVAKSPVNILDGPRALLKYFLSPSEEKDHLNRSGRPRAVRMKLVKAPVW